ncbi:MAG: MATE family efflux transporter [Balneolales bacterium]|nr:MATE family efflux transporter [Balneolales bacterium]
MSLPFKERFFTEAGTTFRLGLPLIIANLLQMSMAFVDTVMAGNLSTSDLAAVAIGSSILTPVFMFGVGILMAVTPIVAQHFGAGSSVKIGKSVRQSLWLAAILSIPTILLLRNAFPVLELLNLEGNVAELADGYLKAASWGIPGFMGYIALKHFNEAVSVTRPAMYFALVGLFFNILGNYTLMFGHFGFPALGAIGTGYATMIVMWVMFLCMLVFSIQWKDFAEYEIFTGWKLPDPAYMKELLRIGLPIGVTLTMEVSMFAVVSLIMGYISTTAVAAHQIALNLASITFMMAFGLASAITIRVGQQFGRKSLENAVFSAYTGIFMVVMLMTSTAVIFFVFPGALVSIYTDDPSLSSLSIQLLFFAAVFQISDGLQVSGSAALRGLKDTTIPMIVNLIAYWVVGLSAGYYFGFHLDYGPQGLWMGLILGLTTAAVLHNIRFRYLTTRYSFEELYQKQQDDAPADLLNNVNTD